MPKAPHLRIEPPRDPVPRDAHPALSERAIDNLRFIRETMERAGSFTAISGSGIVGTGIVALAATLIAGSDLQSPRWLLTWIVAAAVAGIVSVSLTISKSRASGTPITAGIGRKLALAFFPSLVAGAILTAVALRAGWYPAVPGMWLVMYGAAVMAGGALSVPIVPIMGACFMLTGAFALSAPLILVSWSSADRAVLLNALMAIGFGGLHVVFGYAIARRYGG
jgi:hypothetical protein